MREKHQLDLTEPNYIYISMKVEGFQDWYTSSIVGTPICKNTPIAPSKVRGYLFQSRKFSGQKRCK